MDNWIFRWWESRHELPGGRAAISQGDLADLAADQELTALLIDDPEAWRVRAVEQVDMASALYCRSSRSLQVAPLEDVITQFTGDTSLPSQVRLVLPVATLSKRPLLNFDLSGPGDCPAFLVKRRETAERECRFIEMLAQSEGAELPAELREIVTAICEFTPGPWIRSRRRLEWPFLRLQRYMLATVGSDIDKAIVRQWMAQVNRIRPVIREALDEGADDNSSSENPALVVPLLLDRGLPGVADVLPLLDSLATWIENLKAVAGHARESRTLVAVAEYGRRWEALAECTVPTREPFVVHMAEDRPLRVRRILGRSEQTMLFGDASSNHLLLTLTDPNVEFGRSFQAKDFMGRPIADTTFTGVRETREIFAAYGSDRVRDFHVTICFRLRRPTSALIATLTIEAITWLAVGIAVSQRGQLASGDLAVIAVPTTFAASVLLTRERTSLAGRVQWFGRLRVALAVVALWGMVGYLYVGHHLVTSPPAAHTTTQSLVPATFSSYHPRVSRGPQGLP